MTKYVLVCNDIWVCFERKRLAVQTKRTKFSSTKCKLVHIYSMTLILKIQIKPTTTKNSSGVDKR